MHFNGKKWSFVPVGTPAHALQSVTDDGQGGLWALTDSSPSELWHDVKGHWSKVTPANINNPNFSQLFHIPGGATTLGIGTDSLRPRGLRHRDLLKRRLPGGFPAGSVLIALPVGGKETRSSRGLATPETGEAEAA